MILDKILPGDHQCIFFFTLNYHSVTLDKQRVFFFFLSFFILFYLTLQHCIGFAIYQNESATGIRILLLTNP